MQKPLAYGVLLPRELRDRFRTPGEKAMTARFPVIAINLSENKDPVGIQRGTILTNPRDDDDRYAALTFRTHLCWEAGELAVFGHHLSYYDLFSVDLSRAERMVALLRKIRKAEATLPVNPSDFGQYVALLAPAVGIKYMVMAEDDDTETRNHYPSGWYRIRPIRDAQVYIQNLITEVKEKYVPGVASTLVSSGSS
jgi:hypothetical protein